MEPSRFRASICLNGSGKSIPRLAFDVLAKGQELREASGVPSRGNWIWLRNDSSGPLGKASL